MTYHWLEGNLVYWMKQTLNRLERSDLLIPIKSSTQNSEFPCLYWTSFYLSLEKSVNSWLFHTNWVFLAEFTCTYIFFAPTLDLSYESDKFFSKLLLSFLFSLTIGFFTLFLHNWHWLLVCHFLVLFSLRLQFYWTRDWLLNLRLLVWLVNFHLVGLAIRECKKLRKERRIGITFLMVSTPFNAIWFFEI